MSYAVVFKSLTGNTKMLAEQIRNQKTDEKCVYFGEPDEKALEADDLFVGFWTDKGSCPEEIEEFLKTVHNKRVFLFGTAGFGKEEAYFERILKKVEGILPKDNKTGKGFMCQGKMPQSVKKRYEGILKENPQDERMKMMIENFHMAFSHPDEKDLHQLNEWLKNL